MGCFFRPRTGAHWGAITAIFVVFGAWGFFALRFGALACARTARRFARRFHFGHHFAGAGKMIVCDLKIVVAGDGGGIADP